MGLGCKIAVSIDLLVNPLIYSDIRVSETLSELLQGNPDMLL
jgi:hypothetical protein